MHRQSSAGDRRFHLKAQSGWHHPAPPHTHTHHTHRDRLKFKACEPTVVGAACLPLRETHFCTTVCGIFQQRWGSFTFEARCDVQDGLSNLTGPDPDVVATKVRKTREVVSAVHLDEEQVTLSWHGVCAGCTILSVNFNV